ncbi:GSCOCG00004333001-RA-CDS [Cotesia congregata]|uniref:Pre-mRNA-splicing factor SPF27 n=1 Tax=Cotesia congregata TaxID=51543 RepID=A0A8J2EK57_COTCN|nr:GSCOCG00004333001-RA-CDS [Cotesia congregata]CAG5075572.1 Similar to BCAS2: Pre-mRNA-splicing factor SPF27 (Pongo abelii) [Cotesia congregata]
MANEIVVDALPYIDQGYDETGVREAALAMVEEETRRYRPTKNYLEHLPQLNITSFETDVMKHEFERLQNRLPMEVLSMKRYELPPPPPGKMNDLTAWNESVENSCAQLEHQATRICNLELIMDYGCEAWKSHLEVLVQMVSQAQKQLQTLRKSIQEINWQRKSMQTQGGEKLRALESQWVGLVSKNYEIEQACVQLEQEIYNIMQSRTESVEINDVPTDLQEPGEPETSASEKSIIEANQDSENAEQVNENVAEEEVVNNEANEQDN